MIDPNDLPHAQTKAHTTPSVSVPQPKSAAQITPTDIPPSLIVSDEEFRRLFNARVAETKATSRFIAGDAPLAEGGRRKGLSAIAGELSFIFHGLPGVTPDRICACMADALARIAPDLQPAPGQGTWAEVFRQLLEDFWKKDIARAAKKPGPKTALPTDMVLLPDCSPLEFVYAFLREHPGLMLARWQGQYYVFQDGVYLVMSEEQLAGRLWRFAARCSFRKEDEIVRVKPKTSLIADIMSAFRGSDVLLPDVSAPFWRKPVADMPADEMLVFRNGVLHVPSGRFIGHTPDLFSTCVSDFDFDPNAGEPKEWLRFLHNDILEHDPASIDLLQEFFGLALLNDVSFHKMLAIIGMTRSGKGIILAILRLLVGERSVAGPTLTGMGTQFGMSSLIGKKLCVISDARVSNGGSGVIAERLLMTSSGDFQDVDRKCLPVWSGCLTARVVMASNELPAIKDSSSALAGRMLVIELVKSYLGKEDNGLLGRLKGELPQIALWALAGWKRLKLRGKFEETATSKSLRQMMSNLSSSALSFVENATVREGFTHTDTVYVAFRRFMMECGIDRIPSKETFGRDLRALGIPRQEKMADGVRKYCYPLTVRPEYLPPSHSPVSNPLGGGGTGENARKHGFSELNLPAVAPKPAVIDDTLDLDAIANGICCP